MSMTYTAPDECKPHYSLYLCASCHDCIPERAFILQYAISTLTESPNIFFYVYVVPFMPWKTAPVYSWLDVKQRKQHDQMLMRHERYTAIFGKLSEKLFTSTVQKE